MHIDINLVSLVVLMAFVLLGAMVAFWHVFVTHAERKRHYNPEELRLVDIMRSSENARVRRALGSRAVLPQNWKVQ